MAECPPGQTENWTGATWGTGARICQSDYLVALNNQARAVKAITGQVAVAGAGCYKDDPRTGLRTQFPCHLASNPFRVDEFIRGQYYKPRGGFLGDVIYPAAQIIAPLGAALLMPAAAGLMFQVGPRIVQATEGNVALNLGGILSAAGQVFGGVNTSGWGNISQVLSGGLQIAGAALAPPQQAQAMQPMYYPTTLAAGSQAMRTVAPAAAAIGTVAVGSAAIAAAKAILPKIALALGRRGITLAGAVDLARKLGKFFSSPEAIALYMGITVAELAQLITAHGARKRRRMNPANGRALNRAARRIKSFHRLCQHTDLLKTRRRSSFGRCSTCKKSPCRC